MKSKVLADNISVYVRKDRAGRRYHNIKYDKLTEAVFCHKGKNKVLKGYAKIVYRTGDSVFGEQLLFQFWVTNGVEEYEAKTKNETFEYYFNNEEGFKFLLIATDYIRKVRRE